MPLNLQKVSVFIPKVIVFFSRSTVRKQKSQRDKKMEKKEQAITTEGRNITSLQIPAARLDS